MPALKAILEPEAFEALDAALHDFYQEKDGKHVLWIEGVKEHPETLALRNALNRQQTNAKNLQTELNALKEKYADAPEEMTVEEFNRLKGLVEEYEADPSKKKDGKEAAEAVAAKKMLEQKIANMTTDHEKKTKGLQEKIDKQAIFIGTLLIDEGLTKSLVEAGIPKEYLKATKALLKSSIKVVEEDGEYRAVVPSDTGELEIGEYVNTWVASDEGKIFVPPAKGSDAGGPGKQRQPGGSDQKNPWKGDDWPDKKPNLTQQGLLLKTNRPLAEKLAKQAGVTLPPAQ